ncbi:hypothetical protein WME98_06255 [Sorangium sp. So ce296]
MSFVVAGGGVIIGVAVPWLICKHNHLLLKRTGEGSGQGEREPAKHAPAR